MSAQFRQSGKCISRQAPVQQRPPNMQHAVSILRVSSKKQLNSGDGIENQRRGNREYITRKRYRLHREFVLAETGDSDEREVFEEVLTYLIDNKRGIDVVVFWKVDRITRGGVGNYYALKALLAKHGIRIEFATQQIDETPAGELMESMLAAAARFENRLRVDRTIGVERILTKEGYWCRAAPTGFVNGRDKNGKPILLPHPDPRQWELLGYGLRKQMDGAHKLTEVARELQAKGLRSNKGNPVSKQGWYKLCRSPVYGGLLCEKWTDGQFVRAKFDGPLTTDEWHRLQRVLDDRNTVARRLPRQAANPDFPLRGFLRCPRCGQAVRGYAAENRHGRRFPYYDCRNAACRFRVPVAETHTKFVALLRDITPSRELLEAFRRIVLGVWEQEYRELNAASNDLQKTVAKLREEKRAVFDLLKASAGNAALVEELQEEFRRISKELTVATVARNAAEVEEYEAEAVVGTCLYFIERLVELWQAWPVDLQNRLQVMVFPEGVSHAVLEGAVEPKLSLVYAAIEEPTTVAAPRCRVANSLLHALIEWYKILRALPDAQKSLLRF
jgi:DNA invertase Pin-like site-specific DNA recombinase